MNVLILGGAGFIGQHLTHALLKTRHNRVVVIDNLSTSSINLEDFADYKNLFELIEQDITTMDDKELFKLVRKANVVYNLAGSVGVENIDKNPRETLFNNVALMNKLIPIFERANTHVVFASTSEIYGNGPFTEDSKATIGSSDKLRWGYAASKLLTEFMIRAGEYPYNIVRFFNIVGPGQLGDYGMVLPRFIEAAKQNKPLTVYGNGEQMRSFCHIDDAVTMLMGVIKHPNEVFNIGNGNNAITIEQLAKLVVHITESESEIEMVDYTRDFSSNHADIEYRVCVTKKIEAALNYKPQHGMRKIIEDMI